MGGRALSSGPVCAVAAKNKNKKRVHINFFASRVMWGSLRQAASRAVLAPHHRTLTVAPTLQRHAKIVVLGGDGIGPEVRLQKRKKKKRKRKKKRKENGGERGGGRRGKRHMFWLVLHRELNASGEERNSWPPSGWETGDRAAVLHACCSIKTETL